MLLSHAVRAVYIESCSMFVRGGVYRVVRYAMGSTAAKFSVALPIPQIGCTVFANEREFLSRASKATSSAAADAENTE
jgi:hypothetical protein